MAPAFVRPKRFHTSSLLSGLLCRWETIVAVLVTSVVPGGTAEQDDAMVQALELENSPPPGARVRMAGPWESGWRIVSLWESQEAFEAFLEERLLPALERAGRPAPTFEISPIERVRVVG